MIIDRLVAAAARKKNEDKGFTLIELLVVVIIIGILAAIAIPIFLNQREGAWKATVESDVNNAIIAVESAAQTNNGGYTGFGPTVTATGATPGTIGTAPNTTQVTASTNNTVTITFSGNTYTVVGSNTDLGAKTYTYSSTTGAKVWAP